MCGFFAGFRTRPLQTRSRNVRNPAVLALGNVRNALALKPGKYETSRLWLQGNVPLALALGSIAGPES